MTERIRVRRPWLAVLTPSAAALFSTVLVWATGHDPGVAALGTAATTAAPATGALSALPSVTPTQGPAVVGRQIAAQEAELRRLAAQLRALRSGGPSSARTGSTAGTASATRPATYPHPSSGVPSPSRGRPAPTTRPAAPTRPTRPTQPAQPTRAPAPVHTTAPPAPPPIPTPHVTTRSS